MHILYWEVGCHASVATEAAPAPGRGLPADLPRKQHFFFLKFVQAKFSVFFTWNLILKLISLWIPRLFSKFFGRQLKFMSKTDKTGYPVNVTLPVQIQICRFTLQPLQLLNNLSKAARN